MAHPAECALLSFEGGALLEHLAEDPTGAAAVVAELQTFAALSYILEKRIVDLQEMVNFYELNWFEPPRQKNPGALLASFGGPD
jgi:hypothetical protein